MNMKNILAASALIAASATANAVTLGDIFRDSSLSPVTDTGGSHVALANPSTDSALATLLLEFAGNANFNSFGIYDTNSGSVERLEVFGGTAGPTTSATIQFNLAAGTASFGSQTIATKGGFGFYIGTKDAGDFYSNSDLNGGVDYALMFDTKGNGNSKLKGAHVIVAFEDLPLASADWDYNDLVVGVTNVTPVPLPAGVLLFGAGALGLGAVRKLAVKNCETQIA